MSNLLPTDQFENHLPMSDQTHGGKSGLVHWTTQISKETMSCNTDDKDSKMSIKPTGLMSNVPRLDNVDVYNGHDQGFITTTSGQSFLPSSVEGYVGFKSEASIKLNPVGSLQELCIARNFPFPIYTFSDRNSNEYNVRFKVTCSIYFYISSGTGFTKQEAKREAAYLMYKQIEKLTSEDLHKITDNKCEYKDETHNDMSYLCNESTTTLLKRFFGSICEPKTPNLQNIEKYTNGFKLTAADTLKMISERENFTLNCVVNSENSDKVEVLMQLNTTPVIVVSESGKNIYDAEESAANVILTYLKLVLNI